MLDWESCCNIHYAVDRPSNSCILQRKQFRYKQYTCADAFAGHTGRASLEDMYGDYLQLLPQYRGCADLQGVTIERAVFGFVPNWHDQPLAPCTSRLLQIGDAAGNRSALSFAGAAQAVMLAGI